jgi:hypothetical protein
LLRLSAEGAAAIDKIALVGAESSELQSRKMEVDGGVRPSVRVAGSHRRGRRGRQDKADLSCRGLGGRDAAAVWRHLDYCCASRRDLVLQTQAIVLKAPHRLPEFRTRPLFDPPSVTGRKLRSAEIQQLREAEAGASPTETACHLP